MTKLDSKPCIGRLIEEYYTVGRCDAGNVPPCTCSNQPQAHMIGVLANDLEISYTNKALRDGKPPARAHLIGENKRDGFLRRAAKKLPPHPPGCKYP